jgi:hypothetical protein
MKFTESVSNKMNETGGLTWRPRVFVATAEDTERLSVFSDLALLKKVSVSKLYPMESSAKPRHFQGVQTHALGSALDSMGQIMSLW